jgi:WD40 repeat protein
MQRSKRAECVSALQLQSAKPQPLAFSLDGKHLATGSDRGLIQFWNHQTGRLRNDLVYQAQK